MSVLSALEILMTIRL